MSKQLPKPGDRVGCVCGPGEFPQDDAGIVIAVYDDAWYSDLPADGAEWEIHKARQFSRAQQ